MTADFNTLWGNHPMNKEKDDSPCKNKSGTAAFANQCAIRMGVCFKRSAVDLSSFKKVRCWFHDKSEEHILRAEELANWMKTQKTQFGEVDIKKKSDNISDADYKGKTGIAFFMNFWGPGNSGDHIDLWNKDKMAKGSPDYFSLSQEVWFWELA